MKTFKTILVMLMMCFTLSMTAQTILVGNLSTNMSKEEAKAEVVNNKNLYKDLSIGSYKFKLYHQNNGFDSDGKLNSVKLNPSGGVFGLDIITSRLIFEDLINFFTINGFSCKLNTVNPLTFEVGKVVTLESDNDERTVQFAVIPYGSKYLLNLVISKYDKTVSEQYKKIKSDF